MFKIDSKIPLPPLREPTTHYPFKKMKAGDSFFVLIEKLSDVSRARCAAIQYGKRHKVKFATRKVDGGLRIWRIK